MAKMAIYGNLSIKLKKIAEIHCNFSRPDRNIARRKNYKSANRAPPGYRRGKPQGQNFRAKFRGDQISGGKLAKLAKLEIMQKIQSRF